MILRTKEVTIGALGTKRHSKEILRETLASQTLAKLLVQVVYFGLGVLASRGTVFGGYSPFGAALAAAAPFPNIIAVTAGTIVGSLLPGAVNEGIRYLAAILATAAIRWTLNDLKRLNKSQLYAPIVAFVPIFATGMAMSTASLITSTTIVSNLTEALLSAGAAYFFTQTVKALSGSRGAAALSQQELACVALTGCIGILAFANVMIGYVSVGRILAVLAVLYCAQYGGVGGGSISGIATGIIFSLSSASLSYIAGAYAFGGLIAGLFSPLGRIAVAGAFILSNGIVALQTGNTATVVAGAYEVMAATLLYMLVPKSATQGLAQIFTTPVDKPNVDGMRRSVIMRLDFASKTLSDVSSCVDEVSKKLKQISVSDLNQVYQKTATSVCGRCGLKALCWQQEYSNTMNAFNDLTQALKGKHKITQEDFPQHFRERCNRLSEVVGAVNRYYTGYQANAAADRRISEVRGVVYDQFCGMSEILEDMAQELELYEKYDFALGEQLSTMLRASGVLPIDVSCRVDRYNRLSVEIEAAKEEAAALFKKDLLRQIDRVCGRKMDAPCISTAPDRCRIQFSEKPAYQAELAIAQHVCNNGSLCGDHCTYFNDGLGRMVMIVSDGMGSGGRAAVDGAMAAGILAKLAKAGISFDCALRIVNSALLVKSGDESLATLDVARVDLFSGKAEFCKAGAAVSYVVRKGKIHRVDLPSLPAGILTEISFAKETYQLQEGDRLLMISDGVLTEGDAWLEGELLTWEDQGEEEFAQRIVELAREKRKDGHDDDITVLAATIQILP